MHPEADAFLDAIFDNPDDDTPRLAYADWLQEHDEEALAEFVRLGCAVARLRNHQPGRVELREREKKAYAVVKKRWAEFFSATGAKKDWFHRGFLTRGLTLPGDAYLLSDQKGWEWFPFQRLHLQKCSVGTERLGTRLELLARTEQLQLEHVDRNFAPDVLIHLARNRRFTRLKYLTIYGVRASAAALRELANAPWIHTVREVTLAIRVNRDAVADGIEWVVGINRTDNRVDRNAPARERLLAYADAAASRLLE